MAGKAAALDGVCHDATPFTFSEEDPAVDFFGQQLVKGSWFWKSKRWIECWQVAQCKPGFHLGGGGGHLPPLGF